MFHTLVAEPVRFHPGIHPTAMASGQFPGYPYGYPMMPGPAPWGTYPMVPAPVPGMGPPLQPGSPTAPSWHPQVASQPPSPGTTTSQDTANGLGFDSSGLPVDPWRGTTNIEASGTHPSATAATGASPEAASATEPRQSAGASPLQSPPIAPPVQAPS